MPAYTVHKHDTNQENMRKWYKINVSAQRAIPPCSLPIICIICLHLDIFIATLALILLTHTLYFSCRVIRTCLSHESTLRAWIDAVKESKDFRSDIVFVMYNSTNGKECVCVVPWLVQERVTCNRQREALLFIAFVCVCVRACVRACVRVCVCVVL